MTHFLEYAIGHWSIFTCDLGRTLYSMTMLPFIVRRLLLTLPVVWIVVTLVSVVKWTRFFTVVVINSLLAFPGILFAIALVAFLGPGLDRLVFALASMA